MSLELENTLKELNISYNNIQLEKVNKFINKILLFNEKFNLVSNSNSNYNSILNSHVIDSVFGLSIINEVNPKEILDVGSGAGFPGIVLSIFDPFRTYYLLERGQKRANFLSLVSLELGLSNVQILNKSVENETNTYEFITFRAFRDLSEYSNVLKSKLKPNGLIMAYKGKLSTINAEVSLIKNTFTNVKIVPYQIIDNKERNFLLLSNEY